jgi:ABC-type uncharacterized transport system auxiliary subunit
MTRRSAPRPAPAPRLGAAILAVAVVTSGCALSSKATPLELHYFSPELALPAPAPAAAPTEPARAARLPLKLGRVSASDHLRYRIVHRDSQVALELYDTLRWTEPPDDYVRRALGRALFDARPCEQAVAGRAPALEVEVTAFEDVIAAGHHAGRVQLHYQLHDERVVLSRGVVTVDRPASGPEIERVVTAIGQAMDAATAELADRVVARLAPAP